MRLVASVCQQQSRLSRLTISLCQYIYIYRENSQSALAWLTVSIVLRLPFLSLPQQLLQLPAPAPAPAPVPTPAVGVADKDVLPSHWQFDLPLASSFLLGLFVLLMESALPPSAAV